MVMGMAVSECESDWFVAFEQELRQLRTKKARSQFAIKTNIIEANQSIDDLVAAFNSFHVAKGLKLEPAGSWRSSKSCANCGRRRRGSTWRRD